LRQADVGGGSDVWGRHVSDFVLISC
jgi:hypothetical protein